MSRQNAREQAAHFVENETAFHLGALPTEQSHPRTADLSEVLRRDIAAGLDRLFAVDDDIPPVAARAIAGASFQTLIEAFVRAMTDRRRIVFTGCGATGRLSILLEAAWRGFWRDMEACDREAFSGLADLAQSVMAGGDYALIRSVEGFEDFSEFGRRQLGETGAGEGDVVVAITEGGETSFVIGTAWEGLARGADVFFVFNNPVPVLAANVDRSRAILAEPRITAIDLATGPMAIAGSTRLQATTIELLVVGAALETALGRYLKSRTGASRTAVANRVPANDYPELLRTLLDRLRTPENLEALAGFATFEQGVYAAGGRITYAAEDYLLDILTDTTERAPTFSLPAFRKHGDDSAPASWTFLKHPCLPTPEAWSRLLRRDPRCLDWTADTYRDLGAPEALIATPPELGRTELHRFHIGCEDDPSRHATGNDALAAITAGEGAGAGFREGFSAFADPFNRTASLHIGSPCAITPTRPAFVVACNPGRSPLDLPMHLAVKLVLNTLSTATLARMGRVTGNWMTCVEPGNKKLIDRGTRLIASLTRVDYRTACERLFAGIEAVRTMREQGESAVSPVQWAIRRYGTG